MKQIEKELVVQYDAGIDPSFLDNEYGHKPYIPSIIELIKNARDWSAVLVWIITNLGKGLLRVVDDGVGMNEENRKKISWVGRRDKSLPGQSGKFGTGRLMMLFSWAKSCTIRTVAKDDARFVWTCTFTRQEFSDAVANRGKMSWKRINKTTETWPYDFSTGSEFTFELENSSRQSIVRGIKLAEELSARLPMKVLDAIRIDSERKKLPAKKIVGQKFMFCEVVEPLGLVSMVLYRPVKRHQDEALRFGGVEFGEVPITNFRYVLSPQQKEELPETYMLTELVAGEIIVEYLGKYVNSDRFTMSPDIADQFETRHLLKLLARLAPQVQEALEIKGSAAVITRADEETLERVRARFYDKFGKGQKPPGFGEDDQDDKKKKPPLIICPPPKPDYRKPVRLHVLDKNGNPCDEFELGETIMVVAEFGEVQKDVWSIKNLVWRLEESCADRVKKTDTGITMIASKVGDAYIQTDVTQSTGTPTTLWAAARYKVVENRAFRLSVEGERTIKVGDLFVLFGCNTDKLRGTMVWQHSGDGDLEIAGKRATFKATRRGSASVKASDSSNVNVSSSCSFLIEPDPPKLFPIRDHWFVMKHHDLKDLKKPVEMYEVTGREGLVHKIVINAKDPAYLEAQRRGPDSLELFLFQAIALEYPRFTRIGLKKLDPNREMDELPDVLEEIIREGYEILGTLLAP